MRVLNVVSVLSAREGGGNAERTLQLSRSLAKAGDNCTILTLAIGNPVERSQQLGAVRLVSLPCISSRFQVPLVRWAIIRELVRNTDVIHLMGHWSILGALVSVAARKEGVPYVVSPAGALPLFGRSRLFKRFFNWLIGRKLVREAATWIAITKAECDDFAAYGVRPSLVKVLPNGVDEADFNPVDDPGSDNSHERELLILFMGRLNPIKGPDLLLQAFSEVASEFPTAKMVFAGPDEGLLFALEDQAKKLGIGCRVQFAGFVAGPKKSSLYRHASLLVVPSRHEAMSIVAVEGGICGTPVLMTDQCGLDDLTEVDPRLVVPASVDGLTQGLRIALSDLQRLRDWGRKWQSLVRERYTWSDLTIKFRDILNVAITKVSRNAGHAARLRVSDQKDIE